MKPSAVIQNKLCSHGLGHVLVKGLCSPFKQLGDDCTLTLRSVTAGARESGGGKTEVGGTEGAV